jgi:signal transduction histidine kinase
MGPLHLLLVEDSEHDAGLLLRHLRDNGYETEHRRVDNGHDMQEALRTEEWDLIISDYTLPGFGGLKALAIAKQDSPDTPFIIVSGKTGEDSVAEAMVAGAHDYVMKDNLARLLPAIGRELREAELRRERKQENEQLTDVVADLELEIADHRRIETALLDANYQAEQANLAKTGFLANMSHELRTPLNSIIGFAELLMLEPEDVIDNESRQKLGYILDSAWHLLSLINDILDLSKIEAGKLIFEAGPVNIPDVIDATLVMLRAKASKAHVSLHSEIEPGITKLIADERKLKQILTNLIGNAIKFSNEQGQVRVRVATVGLEDFKAHCVTADSLEPHLTKFVCFSVEDDGIGIGADDIGKLFQPFVQLDAFLTRRHEGSGLGLHLSRQLVELHGGCIWAESEPGKGSTFSFIIPCGPRD